MRECRGSQRDPGPGDDDGGGTGAKRSETERNGADTERRRRNSPDHDDRHRRVGDRTQRAAPRLEPRPGTFCTDHEGCNVSDVPTLQQNAAARQDK
jgi:hypothetical protein